MSDAYLSLNNLKMPVIGFGTSHLCNGNKEEITKVIQHALELGYKAIDTAAMYNTEEMVGEAIKLSGVSRDTLFITTKLSEFDHRPDDVPTAFSNSLKKLGLDYVDLYLIHWPVAFVRNTEPLLEDTGIDYMDTWRALEKLHQKSPDKLRNIGVSNFSIKKLKRILKKGNIKPVVNQIEMNPYFQQKEMLEFCNKNNIIVTAYSPLGRGDKSNLLKDEKLNKIASKNKIGAAQAAINWCISKGCTVIPRSSNQERIKENLKTYKLSSEDIEIIDSMNTNKRMFDRGMDVLGKSCFDD